MEEKSVKLTLEDDGISVEACENLSNEDCISLLLSAYAEFVIFGTNNLAYRDALLDSGIRFLKDQRSKT